MGWFQAMVRWYSSMVGNTLANSWMARSMAKEFLPTLMGVPTRAIGRTVCLMAKDLSSQRKVSSGAT